MDVREGVVWHDGSPLTPEDVVWSLERAGDPRAATRVRSSGRSLGNFKIEGQRITADVKQLRPDHLQVDGVPDRLRAAQGLLQKVGAEGFEKKPIGTGPYMVDEYQGNAFLRLKPNDKYWGPQAGVRDRHLQVRARRRRAASPRSRAAPPT